MDQRSYAVEKFNSRRARIGVLGLGYAGLPLACTFAESGFETIGFDIDRRKIESLKNGKSYIAHLDAERTSKLVSAGIFNPTTDFTRLGDCDAAIICVPTPLDLNRCPDLRYVRATATKVASHLHSGQLVVLESTTYPGTTDEIVLPMLAETGLTVGVDYFLAFSPEREDPANQSFSTKTIPKVVGGTTPACTEVATAAYSQVLDRVVPVSSTRVAEAAKLLENIYRCVNIALINEMKLLFERMDVDVWEVIRAASTKPFGFTPFYPGPGLGGHCIPIDPFYLTWKARQYDFVTRFIELAGEINTRMHEHVVEKLSEGLNLRGRALRGADVLILGVAYKSDVDDVRESPALAIIRLLDRKLARVRYHDPHVPVLQTRHLDRRLASVELTPDTVAAADAVVIVTDHRAVDYSMVLERAKLVVDSRNATVRYRKEHHNVILARLPAGRENEKAPGSTLGSFFGRSLFQEGSERLKIRRGALTDAGRPRSPGLGVEPSLAQFTDSFDEVGLTDVHQDRPVAVVGGSEHDDLSRTEDRARLANRLNRVGLRSDSDPRHDRCSY